MPTDQRDLEEKTVVRCIAHLGESLGQEVDDPQQLRGREPLGLGRHRHPIGRSGIDQLSGIGSGSEQKERSGMRQRSASDLPDVGTLSNDRMYRPEDAPEITLRQGVEQLCIGVVLPAPE